MPRFGRKAASSFRRNPESSFKLLAAFLVITIFLIIKEFHNITYHSPPKRTVGARIQFADWKNGTGDADKAKADKVRAGMKYMFWKYRQNAWGYDDIKPVSGGFKNSRNGWGAFIVDASTTLALMGLWDELKLSIAHIVKIDFTTSETLVDPFETTIRYLGALVSLIDLVDAGIIPEAIIDEQTRDTILRQAVSLANSLAPAYDTPTGLPWPRVNVSTMRGEPDPPKPWLKVEKPIYKNPVSGLARAGSNILENRVLTRLTGDPIYAANATKIWAPLVWNPYKTEWPGLVDMPIDIMTGEPVARRKSWDASHDSYYEYLLKISLLSPPHDPYLETYKQRFQAAAYSLRTHLSSRSAPQKNHYTQHHFIGTQNGPWYENQQSHLACFAPATILLGAKSLNQPYLLTFAKSLLEGCRHVYHASPMKLGPETWSWIPKFGFDDPVYKPQTPRQKTELDEMGVWMVDRSYKLRPEYVELLFYAYRITGEERYREWAWEVWLALDRECRTSFGFAGLRDVGGEGGKDGNGKVWIDEQESFFAAETLKYLWLVFSRVDVASLDSWVFSTEAHLFRMIR